jgi:hypothetical protein
MCFKCGYFKVSPRDAVKPRFVDRAKLGKLLGHAVRSERTNWSDPLKGKRKETDRLIVSELSSDSTWTSFRFSNTNSVARAIPIHI